MKLNIVTQPAHLQCEICRQSDVNKIKVVCHRCGRAFCDQHAKAPPWTWFCRRWDFIGMDLPMKRRDIVYCQDCVCQQLNKQGIWSYLVKCAQQIRLPGAYFLTAERPPLPVAPHISAKATENLKGEITLDATGKYFSSKAKEASGQLIITMQFTNRDRDRFNRYRRRSGLKQSDLLRLHAGFALLKGTANLQFDPEVEACLVRNDTFVLADAVQAQPFFTGAGAHQDSKWELPLDYRIVRLDQKEMLLPVQIIPTLVQDGAQQSIELTVQLRSDATDYIDFETAQIDQLILRAPMDLGSIKDVSPSALLSNDSGEEAGGSFTLTAKWKNTSIADKTKFCTFSVRYENQLQREMTLTGELVVTFSGALSQLKDVRLFHAWGTAHKTEPLVRRTQVKINFSLNLNALTFQALYMPDPVQAEYTGVVPDSEFVTRLANELCGMDMYLRKVIENPVRTSKSGAHIGTLLWDLEGRRYRGVFPIDFHLVLSGETNAGNPQRNKMKVEIKTQGMANDAHLRDEITGLQNGLLGAVAKVYEEMSSVTSTASDEKEPFNLEDAALAGVLANLANELQQRLQGH